jgi:glycosyltransferase involved in cell wall biosynthesis
MTGRLCVFPNDPLEAYYKKGEVKERYFNPLGLFDEIHVITLADSDIEEEKVKEMAGDATLVIHAVGKVDLANLHSKKRQILKIVKDIKPAVIRSYNPLIQGWLASYCSRELQVPLVVSLHSHYDTDLAQSRLRRKKYSSYVKLMLTKGITQSDAIKNADCVICAYEYLIPFAKKHGAKDVRVIYNRVNLKRFSENTQKALALDRPAIICVGNLTEEKNQECLIRVVKDLDVHLVLVGDGELYDHLHSLAREIGVDEKTTFVRSVANSEIHKYYASATIFALPMRLGGVPIPVLEAFASGLPVVLPKPANDQHREEVLEGLAVFTDNTPESFRETLAMLLSDPGSIKELGKKGKERMKMYDSSIMEEKEASLYKDLIKR